MRRLFALLLITLPLTGGTSAYAYNDYNTPAIPLYATDAQVQEAIDYPLANGDIHFTDLSLGGVQFAAIAEARPGANVMFDTTLYGTGILNRSWVDPALATADGYMPGGLMDSDNAQVIADTFAIYFENENLHVYELCHKGRQPGAVHSAIWLGVDMGPVVYAYTYAYTDNNYKALNCYTDTSGYVHVEYDVGDYLLFCDAPLQYR